MLIVTVGLSTQFISYLYESKLTITSAAWFSFTLWAIAALDGALNTNNIRKASTLLFLLPLLLPYSKETIEALKTLPLPENFSPTPDSVLVRVCDHATPPSWEHFWNAALYVSDYGCRVGGASTRLDCNFENREFTEGLSGIVCVTRSVQDERVVLSTRYIEIKRSSVNY